jgi:hypothetical protein
MSHCSKLLKATLCVALAGLLSACSSNSALDYADAGTTALGIAQGATELNPVIGIAGDATAPVVSLIVKAGVREYMDSQGYSECHIDRTVNAGSVLGVTNNLLWLAGASTPVGLAAGAMAAVIYYAEQDCAVVRWTVILDPETGETTFGGWDE